MRTSEEEGARASLRAPSHGTGKVLVVGDNEDVRQLTKVVLQSFGYNVMVAIDGEEAIRIFLEHKEELQLVILDVVLSKKSGREIYEAIRMARSDAQVIFASGYAADIIQKEGIADKNLNYIPNPFTPLKLLKTVREVLDR